MLDRLLDRLVLRPSTEPVFNYGRRQRLVDFSDGTLEFWCQTHGCDTEDDASLFVLKFGGTLSRAERSGSHPVDFWPDVPTTTWAMNPPGYGASSGPASLSTLGEAGRVAYRAISRVAAGRPVLVVGSSLGAVVAMHVVARCPADGVIVRNPPAIREVILHRFGWWNVVAIMMGYQVPRDLCAVQNAARCHVPAVFITSGKDRIVPPGCQELVYDSYSGPKQRLHLDRSGHDTTFSPRQRTQFSPMASWMLGSVLEGAPQVSQDSQDGSSVRSLVYADRFGRAS